VGAVTARRFRPGVIVALLVVATCVLTVPVAAHGDVGLALVTSTAEVEMPDVTGLTRAQAEASLTDIGLEPDVRGSTGSDQEVVVLQVPTGGFRLPVGSRVKIILGPPEASSPSVTPTATTTEPPASPAAGPTERATPPRGPTATTATPATPTDTAPATIPTTPTRGERGAVPDWLLPGLLGVVAVLGGAWLTARGVRARRERRWVAEHVRASPRPGEVTETTSDQPGVSPTHSIRALPHPAAVDEQVEIDRQDGGPRRGA
jgi:hypothetical protein